MRVFRHRRTVGRLRAVRSVALLLLSGFASAAGLPSHRSERTDRAGGDRSPCAHVAEAARRFRIPERWIRAVIQVESAGRVRAVSSAGAMGLMQIMPDTWADLRIRHRLGRDPFDPRDNILGGTAYLREMYNRFGSPGFLAAYNAGPARYQQYLDNGRPLPRETRAYLATLLPTLGLASSDDTGTAIPLPPDWRESPLFVERSNSSAAADRPQEMRSSTDDPSTPKARTEDADVPQSSGMFVAHSRMDE